MRVPALTAFITVLALALGALPVEAAQRSRQRAEEPPPPPPFRVTVPTKSLELATAGLSMPTRSVLGTYEYDTLCFRNPLTIYLENAFSNDAIADMSQAFSIVAHDTGYRTPAGSGDLFKTRETQKAEIQVGALISGLHHTGCMSPLGASGGNAIATITIDWQVFDPLEQKIILRTRTTATGKIPFDSQSRALAAQVTLVAFKAAAKSLLSSPEFVALVTDPNAPPQMAPSTELFPQANNTAQPVMAMQIASIPLSTRPFKEQVTDLQRHVVTVRTAGGTGTGFYIADGIVMTNQHVIGGVTRAKVRFLDGREIDAEVVASDIRRDVALLKTQNVGVSGLPLRREKPELTSTVYVIGSPLGQENEGTISSGIVSAFRTFEDGPMIQSDVAVTGGNSGGPMFDDKGNVIAITVSGRLHPETGSQIDVNFFIPIADALEKLYIQPVLDPGHAPMLVAAPPPPPAQLATAAPIPPMPAGAIPIKREINVSMFPAAGPVKNSGHSRALTGVVAGIGTAGTFDFARPDGVSCSGKWTTLMSKPQSGSLIDLHRNVTGLSASPDGMVGGLAIGACSNTATFQAEYYVVPNLDSGFGVATDSDGNIYKIIF